MANNKMMTLNTKCSRCYPTLEFVFQLFDPSGPSYKYDRNDNSKYR